MKEITRIHLAKIPYEIEIEAKKDLEKYLNALKKIFWRRKHFSGC